MKILYLTDLNYIGYLDKDFQMGLRPPMSWISALKPFHCHYLRLNEIKDNNFDITILSCLKAGTDLISIDDLKLLKSVSKKILFQHESDHRSFYKENSLLRNYILNYIIFNIDGILVHNELDKKYYESLFNKPCFIHEQLIFDIYPNIPPPTNKSGILLGGIDDRYGNLDGYILCNTITNEKIHCFGKKTEDIPDLHYIDHIWDYVKYNQLLSNFKIGINVSPMAQGGSFPLQCAMVKVPCIGWDNCHTLKTCFPDLVVPYGDFTQLKNIINILINDIEYYNQIVEKGRSIFESQYSISQYKLNMQSIFDCLLN